MQTNFRSIPPDPDFENGVEPVDGLGDGRPDATEVVTVDFADDRVGRPGVDGSDLGRRRRPHGDVVTDHLEVDRDSGSVVREVTVDVVDVPTAQHQYASASPAGVGDQPPTGRLVGDCGRTGDDQMFERNIACNLERLRWSPRSSGSV